MNLPLGGMAPKRRVTPCTVAAISAVAVILPLIATVQPAAAARPKCLGSTATIVGNNKPNHIRGTPHRDVIVANGGHDVIDGDGGRDKICGGPGNDRIDGGGRDDRLVGGSGDDRIWGHGGNDLIVGDTSGGFVHAPRNLANRHRIAKQHLY